MAQIEINRVISDSHIHIGQWYDHYLTPKELSRFAKRHSIMSIALSSTSICCNDYSAALDEIASAIEMAFADIVPVLWITSSMIEDDAVQMFIDSDIKWKCIKIHPKIDKDYWLQRNSQKILLSLARRMQCPILIHTGEMEYCYPLEYEKVIQDNPDIKFIMAHGRPLDQSIAILSQCANSYVDTAFMPITDIMKISSLGFSNRIIWGTDYPIGLYATSCLRYNLEYQYRLLQLKVRLPKIEYEQITNTNFKNLFYGKIR